MGCESSTEAGAPEEYGWPGLTEEEEKEIDAKWKVFDKDGSGAVDVKELEDVMRSMGAKVQEGDAKRMIKEADSGAEGNHNRKMEKEEFRDMMKE
jgi:Ca2+-binding EF-hand superfamily protein